VASFPFLQSRSPSLSQSKNGQPPYHRHVLNSLHRIREPHRDGLQHQKEVKVAAAWSPADTHLCADNPPVHDRYAVSSAAGALRAYSSVGPKILRLQQGGQDLTVLFADATTPCSTHVSCLSSHTSHVVRRTLGIGDREGQQMVPHDLIELRRSLSCYVQL